MKNNRYVHKLCWNKNNFRILWRKLLMYVHNVYLWLPAAVGRGFIARDIAFKNTAGAAKHQAVALRSGSDMSVFYRCLMDGFQDTLYAHSNRQFYRDCDITGTIDFIFGNAAVVFQNCNIQPRRPLPNQFITITAQGKTDVNQNTGISIQKCVMSPLDSLTADSYLGRPWKNYSTTVIMQTNIGSFLDPTGWTPWISNVDPPNTISYAEYQNTGPGSSVVKRVTWAGYKPSMTAAQASKFTVQSFIDGPNWLPLTDVAFDLSLTWSKLLWSGDRFLKPYTNWRKVRAFFSCGTWFFHS